MNNKEALKFAKEQTHIFGGTMKEFMNFVIPLLEEKPQGDIHDFIAKADEGTLFQLKKEIENALTKIAEQEAYEEARREAMRLDDNEDTAKWRGTH